MITLVELNEKVSKAVVFRAGKRKVIKKSDKDGYKMVDGKEKRMSASEKINRKKAQKKGARKRKAKQAGANRKRSRSLAKRN